MKVVSNDRLYTKHYLKRARQNDSIKNNFVDIIEKNRGDDLNLTKEELYCLNYEDLLEIAIAVVNQEVAITCAHGEDFDDLSDAKCVIARTHAGQRSAAVTGITSKHGALRVVVFESIQHCFHYFYIPLSAYEHLTHSIEILFTNNGGPKFGSKWWAYCVGGCHGRLIESVKDVDFRTMATAKEVVKRRFKRKAA